MKNTGRKNGPKITGYARATQRAIAPAARRKLADLIATAGGMLAGYRRLREAGGEVSYELFLDGASPGQIVSVERAEKLERALERLP